MTNKVIILGCGFSAGVPVAGYNGNVYWGQCDPTNPKNNRLRASIYVEYQGVNILIDTSPDLRQQLLANKLNNFDAVLMTHFHADHCHGIGELWHLYNRQGRLSFNLYADSSTGTDLHNSFAYMFTSQQPAVTLNVLKPYNTNAKINKGDQQITFEYFDQQHGAGKSLGFRFGNMAYSTDFNFIDIGTIERLQNLDLWIVDCLSYTAKPSHNHLDMALKWINRVKPKHAILTHMGPELDYDTLSNQLPASVSLAYDGMVAEF